MTLHCSNSHGTALRLNEIRLNRNNSGNSHVFWIACPDHGACDQNGLNKGGKIDQPAITVTSIALRIFRVFIG
eukprot:6141534-Amphidinium_carterae.1